MKKTLILVLVTALAAISIACAGADGSECAPCSKDSAKNTLIGHSDPPVVEPVELLASTEEAMEWQCIIVDIIIECVDYDTDPCDYCYHPCIGACGVTCEVGVVTACAAAIAAGYPVPSWCKYLGYACIYGFDFICNEACPECEYCTEYKVTYVKSCGWVFTE
jgi:hypothetical protein